MGRIGVGGLEIWWLDRLRVRQLRAIPAILAIMAFPTTNLTFPTIRTVPTVPTVPTILAIPTVPTTVPTIRLSWPSQSLTTPTTRQHPKYHQTYRHRPNTGLTASHWHQHRFSTRNNTIRTSTWMKAQGYKTLKWGQHDHHMPQKCRHVAPTYCTLPRK